MATRRVSDRQYQERIRHFSMAWNAGTLSELEDRAFFLNERHQQLLAHYAPSGRVIDALLIKSSEPTEGVDLPQDYGWGALIDRLRVVTVPATHFTVFEPTAIDAMVPVLQSYLSRDH